MPFIIKHKDEISHKETVYSGAVYKEVVKLYLKHKLYFNFYYNRPYQMGPLIAYCCTYLMKIKLPLTTYLKIAKAFQERKKTSKQTDRKTDKKRTVYANRNDEI